MDTYKSLQDGMAQLDTFKANAFVGDQECDQKTCNFFLALAAAHNDLHDCTLAMHLMRTQAPKGEVQRNIEWANFNGICQHIVRHHHSINHEIIKTIEENLKLLDSPFFKKVTQNINREARQNWDAIVAVAAGGKAGSDVGNYLHMLRNKVGSHYDLTRIGAGYKSRFANDGGEYPLISRGSGALSTRFYFADAAIEGALFLVDDLQLINDILLGKSTIFDQINQSIYYIVCNFITIRSGGYRKFVESADAPAPKPPRH